MKRYTPNFSEHYSGPHEMEEVEHGEWVKLRDVLPLIGMLQELEWATDREWDVQYCPLCELGERKHEPECRLAAVLKTCTEVGK